MIARVEKELTAHGALANDVVVWYWIKLEDQSTMRTPPRRTIAIVVSDMVLKLMWQLHIK